ncbi:MAG TPA: 3-hydroxyacyl-CoA dehydrogenase NAD-binding domain-containing protein [Polyangiaceae bacterium]|nr:3-hydroxyacyl-CoA dehydrogenase NAD-binding domain-containing protein [Polyangiaceae bacterium]
MTLQKPLHQVVVTVLGSGTMGAGIAALVAATGAKTYLLDIVPPGLPAGAPRSARSGLAQNALKALSKSKPPALMSQSVLERLIPGNFEDDLARAVGESDLVIEAVVERLDVKQGLFQKVAAAARPDTILASNTSGIPITAIASALPESARGHFVGLHFFNPPRWMHLLEVIPGAETRPEVAREAADFCDRALGKGIVPCRDTPNFIGNRVGIVEMLLTFRATEEGGYTVEEVDLLNGQLTGRPATGSFRLGDLVGLDVVGHVVRNLEENLSGDPASPQYDPLHQLFRVPEVVQKLVASKRLGDKTGAGFYQKTRGPGGKSQIASLELTTLEYREQRAPDFPELAPLAKLATAERLARVIELPGRAGDFLRRVLLPLFDYSARLTGTISETPQQIDDAMRWGYGWELGPFEMVDAIGVARVVELLRAAGQEPAPALVALAALGAEGRFYAGGASTPTVWVPGRGAVAKVQPEGAIFLDQLREGATLEQNPSASLIDLGDGIACLEFHSKANVLDAGVMDLVRRAPALLVERGFRGLVLGNQAAHFCRGANLVHIAGLIQKKDWAGVEAAVKELQDSFMGLRHGPIPVVAAPIGQTLGGGTEAMLHCAEVQAGADLFQGLVEVGVGVLPAGGGLKEIARRASVWAAQAPEGDPYSWVRRGFETVVMAKVSGSALEARENGFLAATDGITFHKSRVLAEAKKRALGLAVRGWVPPDPNEPIRVIGERGAANLMMGVELFGWGGYASPHDQLIARKVVHVLSGGRGPHDRPVTAQHLLDLEREAFVSLCGEEKSAARIEFMLKNKKPLRN